MALNANSTETFNLRGAAILLVEAGAMDIDIIVHILAGFGAKNIVKCENLADARSATTRNNFDLVIVNIALGNEDGCDFVEWLRRNTAAPNKYAPVIMISPHTPASKVARARDCGAHYLVTKPLTPAILLERILWIAQKQRAFVEVPTYVGPDRRFRFDGLPVGQKGRRVDDLSEHLGAAKAPNMSQSQIDALMAPKKVSL
jgi:DNA-binding response OmpR family regulator